MSIRKQIDKLGNDVFNNSNSPSIETPKITNEEFYDDPLVITTANIKKALRTKNSSDTAPLYGITLEDSKPLSPEEILNSGNFIALASHRLAIAEGKMENAPYIYHGVYVMLDTGEKMPDPEDFGDDEYMKQMIIKQNYFCFVDETVLSRDMMIAKNCVVLVQILDENQRFGVITSAQNINIDYIINQTVTGDARRLESARNIFKGQEYSFLSSGQQ